MCLLVNNNFRQEAKAQRWLNTGAPRKSSIVGKWVTKASAAEPRATLPRNPNISLFLELFLKWILDYLLTRINLCPVERMRILLQKFCWRSAGGSGSLWAVSEEWQGQPGTIFSPRRPLLPSLSSLCSKPCIHVDVSVSHQTHSVAHFQTYWPLTGKKKCQQSKQGFLLDQENYKGLEDNVSWT